MTKFIVRVDDVGQALEQSEPDVDLAYFKEWWAAGRWGEAGVPIYLGVVPARLSQTDLDYLYELETTTGAELCIHGWDHADRILWPRDVMLARSILPRARCVIPPYNKYDERTIEATGQLSYACRKAVLFGGFDGENHRFGEAPTMVGNTLHLSATRELYAHSYVLAEHVELVSDPGYPLVLTLHHRWDAGKWLDGVGKLREALDGRTVAVDKAAPPC